MSSRSTVPRSVQNVGQSNAASAGIRHNGGVRKNQTPRRTRGNALPPFALRLRELRKAHGGGQAEIAEAIGISRGYLGGLETDKEKPGRETLAAIATFYGVSVDSLYRLLPPSGVVEAGEFIKDPYVLSVARFVGHLTARDRRKFTRVVEAAFDTTLEVLESDDVA